MHCIDGIIETQYLNVHIMIVDVFPRTKYLILASFFKYPEYQCQYQCEEDE